MEYFLHILILVTIYGIAASSLNLIAGHTGLLSVSHAAFVGIGAYATAIMSLTWGLSFCTSFVCAMLIAALQAVIVGIPALRVHDDYFVLVTFALQVIATSVFTNWTEVTGGPMGIAGIPQPELFGISLDTHGRMLVLCGIVSGCIFALLARIIRSPYGRVLRAIREDEVLPQAFGKDVMRFKLSAFIISSCFASAAGSLYAVYITFIDPSSFTIQESIFLLAIVIVGGAGNLWGTVFGALLLVGLPEFLRFVGLPSAAAANLRQILYGALLTAMMLWRPRGLFGEFEFRKRYE